MKTWGCVKGFWEGVLVEFSRCFAWEKQRREVNERQVNERLGKMVSLGGFRRDKRKNWERKLKFLEEKRGRWLKKKQRFGWGVFKGSYDVVWGVVSAMRVKNREKEKKKRRPRWRDGYSFLFLSDFGKWREWTWLILGIKILLWKIEVWISIQGVVEGPLDGISTFWWPMIKFTGFQLSILWWLFFSFLVLRDLDLEDLISFLKTWSKRASGQLATSFEFFSIPGSARLAVSHPWRFPSYFFCQLHLAPNFT